MPRACRVAVFVTFSSAGVFFVAAALTVTALPAAIWWAQDANAAASVEPSADLSAAPPLTVPTNFDQWFLPHGRNEGAEGLVDYLSKLALHGNSPLTVTSGWGRTWGPANSDHHLSNSTSWACDLAVAGVSTPTAQGDVAAQRIASALGEPGWTAGNLIKTYNGYRFQLLWKVAGHFDHVHIGVKRV